MKVLLCAIGFCLALEGLFPLLAPDAWKKYLLELSSISSKKIRTVAFVGVVLGLAVVWSVELF